MRVRDDAEAKIAWNDSYHFDGGGDLWSNAPVPFTYRVASLAQDAQAKLTLDLPCGDGRNIGPLAASSEAVVAADSSENAIELAFLRTRRQGVTNCVAIVADVFHSGFAGEQFDVVYCWDLLGHLRSPVPALNELLRVTRAGGFLCASVFATGDSTRGRDMEIAGPDEYIYRRQFYYRFYDHRAVGELARSVSGTVVSIELATWSEPPHPGFRDYEHEHQSWAIIIRK